MLLLVIPETELWDEKKQEFVYTKAVSLRLEHSLVSVSKWESKWRKPFIKTFSDKSGLSSDELIDYIRCMTLTQNVDPSVYLNLTRDNYKQIIAYIDAPMTATWFSDEKKAKPNRRVITSELIYCWMIDFGIPFECQKWHFNRLITLLRVCEAEHRQPKKRSQSDILRKHARLNKQRRKPIKH